MEKEEKILLSFVSDKEEKCYQKNIPMYTNFLNLHQQSLISEQLGKGFRCSFQFWGGYAEAERKLLIFLPDYMEEPETDCICAVHVQSKSADKLNHRDYLGAALGLGIKREQIGDILVQKNGAYIFVLPDMAAFLAANLLKIGRENVSCSVKSLEEVDYQPPEPLKTVQVSASSLRVDKIVAEGFRVSRSDAVSAVQAGRVFVNQREVLKPDFLLNAGDTITLRGKGKVVLRGTEGVSKKGRLRVVLEKY